jgi:hypothetical protein
VTEIKASATAGAGGWARLRRVDAVAGVGGVGARPARQLAERTVTADVELTIRRRIAPGRFSAHLIPYKSLDEPELLDALREVVVIQLEDDPQPLRLLLEEVRRKQVEIGDRRRRRSELHPPLRLDQHAAVIDACLFEPDDS